MSLILKRMSVTKKYFCISDIGNSLSDFSKSMKKICVVEDFPANTVMVYPLE